MAGITAHKLVWIDLLTVLICCGILFHRNLALFLETHINGIITHKFRLKIKGTEPFVHIGFSNQLTDHFEEGI